MIIPEVLKNYLICLADFQDKLLSFQWPFLGGPGTEGARIFNPEEMKIKYPMDIEQIAKHTKIPLGNTVGMCSHRLAYPPLRLYTPYWPIVAIHIAKTKEINAIAFSDLLY